MLRIQLRKEICLDKGCSPELFYPISRYIRILTNWEEFKYEFHITNDLGIQVKIRDFEWLCVDDPKGELA